MINRRPRIHPVVFILIIALICVAITVITLLIMGYRYVTNTDGYTYIGKIVNIEINNNSEKVSSAQPLKGNIKYPDGKASSIDYVNRTILYSNGDKYSGDILQLYKHGRGVMYYKATGDIYEGDFVCDHMTGKGKYIFKNGDCYEGDFLNDKVEGSGVYSWANGSKYVGEFKDGLANGKGVFTFAAKDDGIPARYEGEFFNGMKHGKGTYYFDNGDVYTGMFHNDKRTGTGTYKWANGETYTGNFIDNLRDTRLKNENGEFIYNEDGSYKHGEMAVYTWPNGQSFTGYFEEGTPVTVEN